MTATDLDRVPIAPLREAFERSGLTRSEVARRAGYDESGVARALGYRGTYAYRDGRRYGPYYSRSLSYDAAVRLARAIGVDPHEVGV